MRLILRAAVAGLLIVGLGSAAIPALAQPGLVQTPPTAMRQPLSEPDRQIVAAVIAAARAGDVGRIRANMSSLTDPAARHFAEYLLADVGGASMSFSEIESARRDLVGWPRAQARQQAAERLLSTSGMSPANVIAWFGGGPPLTGEGAMALGAALQASGRTQEATDMLRATWRTKSFEAEVQRTFLARFGMLLTQADHAARLDMLLYGPQGPAARDMIALAPADMQAAAQVRISLRSNAGDNSSSLPASVANSPGVVFERVGYLRRRGQNDAAIALLPQLPPSLPSDEGASRLWRDRYQLVIYALQNRNNLGAYQAAANSGLTAGGDAADAEFYAGWIALTRLRNPAQADVHFARLAQIGSSPITQGRAFYWRGRAAEAQNDQVNAQLYYSQAARFPTVFYGQLAAAKLGNTPIALGRDPDITNADRARFESREPIRMIRNLGDMRQTESFRLLIMGMDDLLPTAAEEALLVDLARGYGDQTVSMMVVRVAAQRGFILPERGYPMRSLPSGVTSPETALILGITRQESGFDPVIVSPAGARGMMQLMPATAALVARQTGISYSGVGQLNDPDTNMRLGSAYLTQMINNFSGSYVMAIAAYNAGPGRPPQWAAFCGDPRTASTDPIDYIECIPLSETRNYVMRVMEGMQVYRARLAGGSAQVTLAGDLRRGSAGGGYTPSTGAAAAYQVTPTQPTYGTPTPQQPQPPPSQPPRPPAAAPF